MSRLCSMFARRIADGSYSVHLKCRKTKTDIVYILIVVLVKSFLVCFYIYFYIYIICVYCIILRTLIYFAMSLFIIFVQLDPSSVNLFSLTDTTYETSAGFLFWFFRRCIHLPTTLKELLIFLKKMWNQKMTAKSLEDFEKLNCSNWQFRSSHWAEHFNKTETNVLTRCRQS